MDPWPMKYVSILGYIRILSLVILILLACCKSEENRVSRETTVTEDGLIIIKVGGIHVNVELAQTHEEQDRGLMYREYLPQNQGMLFVYPYEQPLSFWMRNTFIPLDIAFIDKNGMIVSIQSMEALNEEKRYVSPIPAQYALEMIQGWFKRNGVTVGAHVEF